MAAGVLRRARMTTGFVLILLVIEFLDELVFSAREAAWPLIQADLGLTYVQIGVLLTLPGFLAGFVEPVLGIWADMGRLKALVLGGGILFTLGLVTMAISPAFLPLLLSTILLSPASGAFVGLSQVALMNADPARHEQNMARWTFAGSLGVVGGPLALSAALALDFGWRETLGALAFLALALVIAARRVPFTPALRSNTKSPTSLKAGLMEALRAFRRREVLRWLILLDCSDLMLDILLAYLALYLVNETGVQPEQAALAVAVWTGVGLVGDLLLIFLLERVRGLTYLRYSALLEFALYPAFLLAGDFSVRLAILALLGFFNAGWYSILAGQLYATMPGRGGTAMAVDNIAGFIGSLLPLGVGLVASQFGLQAAMWTLLLGPAALLLGLPRHQPGVPPVISTFS